MLSVALVVLLLALARAFTAQPDPRSLRRLRRRCWSSARWSRPCSAGCGWPSTPTARRPAPRRLAPGRARLPRPGRHHRAGAVRRPGGRRPRRHRAGRARRRRAARRGARRAACPPTARTRLDDADGDAAARPARPVGRHRLAVLLRAARRPVGDLLAERQGGGHLPGGRARCRWPPATRSATRRPGRARSPRGWPRPARSAGCRRCSAASERGAEAFHRAGLDALELGDEAILHVAEFSLEGRSMRGGPAGGLPVRARRAHRDAATGSRDLDDETPAEVREPGRRVARRRGRARLLDGARPLRRARRRPTPCVVLVPRRRRATCAACCTSCRGAPTGCRWT